MDRIQKEILLKEINNFRYISRKYNYKNVNELVGHYIEEGLINSKEELIKIIDLLKKKRGINIDIKNFRDCWAN